MFIPQLEDYLPTSVVVLGAAVVLVMMVWLIFFGRGWGRPSGFALVVLALAWIPLNKPIEGPILMRLGHDKGLVLSDLLALMVLAIAGWRIAVASRSECHETAELSVPESA